MRKSRYIILFNILFPLILSAGGTFTWTIDNYQSFNQGKLTDIKLNEDGILSLAPKSKKYKDIDLNSIFVWDIKKDSKGNIYIATGNDGIIYKINKKGEIKKFFKTSSLAVFKLLIDKNDNIYAATLTRGLIYKIKPSGKGSIFAIFQNDYIWDMKFYKGNILIASGTPGSLYTLNLKTKKFEQLLIVKEMHIICMDVDNKNNIYFGTAQGGAIYKYSNKGNISILYQTGEKEVHCITIDKKKNIIYAGTSDKELSYTSYKTPFFKKETKESERKKENIFDDFQEIKKITSTANAVYKIKENDYITKIIESKGTIFLSLILSDNTLFIGTGDKGIIYSYNTKSEKVEKVVKIDEQQILCFTKTQKSTILFGTGNIGNIYKLEVKYAEKGTYLSKIFDANALAFWGKIHWDSKIPSHTKIKIQTRSGNTEDVDDTWSDWSTPTHFDNSSAQITYPPARFIQFKIDFKTENLKKTPKIYLIKISYLIKNRKPEIINISFQQKPNDHKAKNKSKKPSFKRLSLKNYELKIQWNATDEDKDELIYSLYASLRKLNKWLLIKEEIKNNYYILDTRVLPDGEYIFKIKADDIPSNSIKTHLTNTKISKPIIIDNTPPKITLNYKKLYKNKYKIYGKITDTLSIIISIEYSVDAKNWISVFPNDKIFDSKQENFEFTTSIKKGLVIIKAEDNSGNISTSYIWIK